MSAFLFSCENATYAVPAEHVQLFAGCEEIRSCSEGWEPGALNLAQACAMCFRTPLIHSETSRLLIDVEAAQDACWSRFSLGLSDYSKRRLMERYWLSYRSQLHRRIAADIERHGMVYHIMVHSNSDQREHVRLQILEGSILAKNLSEEWLGTLLRHDLRCTIVANNQTTNLSDELSRAYDPERYAQIRVSVHQDFFLMGTPWRWATIKKHLLDCLAISARRVETVAQQI